jgi:ParB family chromosome partitioning protein
LELHPETAHGAAGGKARQGSASANLAFADATATATGRSERAIQRDAERGESITEAALAKVSGTDLDTGAYLDKLKALPADQQEAQVDMDLWADAARLMTCSSL